MNQTTWIITGGIAIIAVAGLLFIMSGDGLPKAKPAATTITHNTPEQSMPELSAEKAILHTSMGNITVKFYKTAAPRTVDNFLKLARGGFYNGVKFHRVIKGFMDQTGDPLSKDDAKKDFWGTGDPGYKFNDEIATGSPLYQSGYKPGVVAMANSGPNTNGSQFFIMASDTPLPPAYTIFGGVIEGMDTVMAINETPTDQRDRPLTPVVINSITVE